MSDMANNPNTPPSAPAVNLTADVSKYADALVNFLVGRLLSNPRVTKLASWAMITAAAVWHNELGPWVTGALAVTGGAGHVTATVSEPPATS